MYRTLVSEVASTLEVDRGNRGERRRSVPDGHARWCAFRTGQGPCDCPEFPMPEETW